MKSTTRRIGRKIIVDGLTYHYKIHVPKYDEHAQESNLDRSISIDVRGPKETEGLKLQRQIWQHRLKVGDKIAITPAMVAQAIRYEFS